MARRTASSDTAAQAGGGRNLWHAPLFLAGLGMALWVGLARPTLGNPTVRRLDHELHALRTRLLDNPRSDAADFARRAALAVQVAEQSAPDRVAEAHFLLGVALLRLADGAADDQAAVHRRDARANLEEAQRLGVAEDDRPRLRFRLLQAGYPGSPPKQLAESLVALEVPDPDLGEYYDLLSRAYLDQTPPDLAAALDAVSKMRNLVADDLLAQAQLRSGELKLRLHRPPEEARKDLEKVGAQAPPALRAQAQLLLARSYEDEGKWSPAARSWEQVLASPDARPARPLGLYHLGFCCARTGEAARAAAAWQECANTAAGEEGSAAALGLADLALAAGDDAGALACFNRAVHSVSRPEDWKNSLIDLEAARARFRQAADRLRQANKFEWMVKLAEPYQRLAPQAAPLLAAEAAARWAQVRREQASRLADASRKQEEEQAARDLARQAAVTYYRAAGGGDAAAQEDALWMAAECFRDAGDLAQFEEKLRRCLEITAQKERRGRGWLLLAEALAGQRGREADLAQAYLNCIQEDAAPYACRARYQLALRLMAGNHQDDAEAALEQNLKLLRLQDPRDSEAQEKTLLALGRLDFQRRKYREAAARLEEVLGRAEQSGPGMPPSPETTEARFQLAHAYAQLGGEEAKAAEDSLPAGPAGDRAREFHEHEAHAWYFKAAQEFHGLRAALERPEAHGPLTPQDEMLLPFSEADCLFNGGRYDDALKLYGPLANKHAGTVDGINALGGMVRCYSARLGAPQPGDAEEMQKCIALIRQGLKTVVLKEGDRQAWELWLAGADKVAPAP
jgi:hypothetical protein